MTRKSRVKPVAPEFELFINKMRGDISKDFGVDLNFKQTTKMVTRILGNIEINFGVKSQPRSKNQRIQMLIRRKKK